MTVEELELELRRTRQSLQTTIADAAQAEHNAARWDSLVLWIMIAAGALMLLDHSWWPFVGLVAAAMRKRYPDTKLPDGLKAVREVCKL